MPIPTPNADETQSDFMSRCMGNETMLADFPDQAQRAAVCGTAWRDAHPGAAEANGAADSRIRKKETAAHPPRNDPLEYVMSDGSIDRMGDVIEPAGWQLENFHHNPIALFGHNSGFVIGNWRDVAVRGKQLTGRLELMEPVSERLREIHTAVKAGMLRAVSVGFHARKYEPLESSNKGGVRFLEQELVECSLVSVPANPNALAVARALHISREGQQLIFGGIAEADQPAAPRTPPNGGIARKEILTRKLIPMQLSERIEAARGKIVALQDQLTSQIDSNDLVKSEETTDQIEEAQKQLASLERAERALGNNSEIITLPRNQYTSNLPAPMTPAPRAAAWALPKKKEEPGYLFLRHCVAITIAHVTKRPLDQVMTERYGHYGDFDATKEVHDWFTRAATAPATTTTTGWAAELAQTQFGEFFDALMPGAIYSALAPRGFRSTLGRFGQISMPTRSATPTVAGSFVGEGSPIPVRQAAFVAVTLGLKKMAVIVSYTREIAEHSTPQIEGILRQLIQDDTQTAVDTILIDAIAVSSIRPAGLRNGVTVTTATAGGGFTALVGDIKALVGVLAAANSLRAPVWIMNPVQALSISLTQNAGGDFPFQTEINGQRLLGYPVIVSTTMPSGMVILLDAADFWSITGDDPRFDVSDQATLHFEDTTPLQISTAGTPPTLAHPTRSLFQTDSLALRMILPMNWAMRRTGVVAWTQSVTW